MKKHFIENWHYYQWFITIPLIWLIFYFIINLITQHFIGENSILFDELRQKHEQFLQLLAERMKELNHYRENCKCNLAIK